MINENININYFRRSIKKKNFKHILNAFSDFLKEDNEIQKKEYICNELISFDINNERFKKMFEFRNQSDERYRNKKKQKLENYVKNHNIWREVEDFWFDSHSKLIESKKNLINLNDILLNASVSNSKIWLNDYIRFLKENSTVVEKKKIFPNQNGKFQFLKNLHYDDSIPEIIKDLYNCLKNLDNKTNIKYDIRDFLLSREITCYQGYNRLTQKEIIAVIEAIFINSKKDEIKIIIAEKIMALLPINQIEKFQIINEALKKIVVYYNKLYKKNIQLVNIEILNELNYGLFLKFILKMMFAKIQNMQIELIKDNIKIIPEIIKFAWDYQFNEYLNLLVDPKQYKIFVNENYGLNKIENIYLKEDFDNLNGSEIEKELFEISNSSIVNIDYKEMFLECNFNAIFSDEKYKNNFKSMKLIDICQKTIDYRISNYYYKNKNANLMNPEFLEFRQIFRNLASLLKYNPSMKKNFPQFLRERGNIALKFLECKEEEMDDFIEDVMKVVFFKANE